MLFSQKGYLIMIVLHSFSFSLIIKRIPDLKTKIFLILWFWSNPDQLKTATLPRYHQNISIYYDNPSHFHRLGYCISFDHSLDRSTVRIPLKKFIEQIIYAYLMITDLTAWRPNMTVSTLERDTDAEDWFRGGAA